MQFIEKVFDRLGYVSKKNIKKFLVPTSKTIPESIQSEKTYAQLVDAYKSWVYTCIDKNSKSVATLPLKLVIYRNSTGSKVNDGYNIKSALKNVPKQKHGYWLKQNNLTKIEIDDHPYLDLIRKPNGIMTRFILWYETMTKLELGGIVAWYLVKDGLGIPREIWPLPLTQNGLLQPKVEKDLTISYWLYRDSEIKETFDPSELLIIKYPHPKSPFDWFSPIMAQMHPYDIDYYIQQQQANYYKNGVLPSLLAQTDMELGKPQVDEILNQLTEQYGSPTKAGKVMLLHSGLKQGNSFSARDAMLDEVVRYAREKLITSYDLSEGKLGLVRDVNRANMEALEKTYAQDCLLPRTMMLEETIETFLLPVYDQGLMIDFVLPDIEDQEFNLKKADMELKNYAITVNEYRNKEGKEPVAWGDVPWGPLGIMPLMSGSTVREPNEEQEDQKEMLTKSMEPFSQWSKEKRRRAWLDKNNQRRNLYKLYETNIIAYFKAQKDRVLSMFDDAIDRESNIKSFYNIKAFGPKDMGFDKDDEEEIIEEYFSQLYLKMMEESGNTILQKMGITASFVIDGAAKKYLSSRLRTFSKEIIGTTFDDVERVLSNGFNEGISYLEIKSRLREKFDFYERYRTQLIVRSECNAAMNKAEKLALEQEGADKYLLKHWLTDQGENRRDSHIVAEARYEKGIPINENFVVGSDSMDMPGNGSVAEENMNCVCYVMYSRNNIPL